VSTPPTCIAAKQPTAIGAEPLDRERTRLSSFYAAVNVTVSSEWNPKLQRWRHLRFLAVGDHDRGVAPVPSLAVCVHCSTKPPLLIIR